jgi:lipoprotein-releasing system permease protein
MRADVWVRFVAWRWFRSGKDAGPSLKPATAGIAIGVAALLCVIGVMNGFQVGFIDAVLDLDSFHIRVPGASVSASQLEAALPRSVVIVPFVDIRTMVVNGRGKAYPVRVKILEDDMDIRDPAFIKRLEMRSGAFEGGLVIGSEMARRLDARPGDTLDLLAVSADEDTGIRTAMISVVVSGIYHSGYFDFDSGLAFLPRSASSDLGAGEEVMLGVKLSDRYGDERAKSELEAAGIHGVETWREYNRAFFGALRMEKSVMMMLIGLIFIVVGVNIYHSMRKAVYARVDDIATLRALGAGSASIRDIFILDGVVAGAGGAFIGLCLGLLVVMNVNGVFSAIEGMVSILHALVGGKGSAFAFFSPDLFYIGDVPVRLSFPETIFISMAGAASAIVAARVASSRVSAILPSEVLRDE